LFTLERVEPICPTSYPLLTLILPWLGQLILIWRILTRMPPRMLGDTCARVSSVGFPMSGHLAGESSIGIAVAVAKIRHAADAAISKG
jgi:hypothetical protein